jgi:CheY-like chemotaxis protein/CHASE3 domain sensor protein
LPTTQPEAAITAPSRLAYLPARAMGGFVLALVAVLLIGFLSWYSLKTRSESASRVTASAELLSDIQGVLSLAKDLQVGYRGYLVTHDENYLLPYQQARVQLPGRLRQLRARVHADPALASQVDALAQALTDAMTAYAHSIAEDRSGDVVAQLTHGNGALARQAMDQARALVVTTSASAQRSLELNQAAWERAARVSFYVQLGGALTLLLLVLMAAVIASRDYRHRETQNWLRAGQFALAARLQGDLRLESVGETVLDFLTGFLGAQRGAVYLVEGERLQRIAAYASSVAPEAAEFGQGLLGQAARADRALHVTNVPEAYFDVGSALGASKARELLLAPARVGRRTYAVLELGFFRALQPYDLEFLDRVSELLGVSVRSAHDRSRLESLLEETQRQAEELQTQQEELRVTNEELEEQGRLLRQSQAMLEAQQSDLEQSNVQLEEQTQQLESQRDQLTQAQGALEERAAELQRANHYKNEFLANMSHELRTPLNSSLILSKLLADNPQGNLTPEQVHFAETISGAGNDLLALINDILDLSKIEAGKVEVHRETVDVRAMAESMQKTFGPMAQAKGLSLVVEVDPACPPQIVSDRQRLAQILKNLLSNALKFTEKGEVSLRVQAEGGDRISLAVRDTGIGLPADQHDIIFEAFRQADGSTHRKYGGTGLGLSISRDLARLLGGDITVASHPGAGSLFTLELPVHGVEGITQESLRAPERLAPAPVLAPAREPTVAAREARAVAEPLVDDDRYELSGDRTLLVVEDDLEFAGILRDLAHERGFQCVLAHTAAAGLAAAARYAPKAILLDIKLPDHSGLGVLDQLKRDPATRHVPVHVISGSDLAREARELGAVGYASKPVSRDQLVEALQALEAKFTQVMRRVLIVEDDARQRESVVALLGGENIQIEAVSTASQALQALAKATYDCIVMDLNLPDLSGYELLEQMSQREDVPFPPVIVYTGKSLSRDEEQSLRRFSKSIIIKGVRSPERLLDEVTLFLHQVESSLSADRQGMLKAVRNREAALEGRRVLVVEDDVRNVFALSSVLEPKGAKVAIARNGLEALEVLRRETGNDGPGIDLILMDIMMPEMDGLTCMREIRKQPAWARIPIIALTAKAMKDDHDQCLAAGANDYIAKPLDVERLLSLVRVWMPK